MAGRLGAAPSGLSFGNSVAQAGARPVINRWCEFADDSSRRRLQENKRAGSFVLPAHAISIKNKHLLVIYSIPARGFTAAVSVFRGTPPPKPLKCKFVSNRLDARLRQRWAEPTG